MRPIIFRMAEFVCVSILIASIVATMTNAYALILRELMGDTERSALHGSIRMPEAEHGHVPPRAAKGICVGSPRTSDATNSTNKSERQDEKSTKDFPQTIPKSSAPSESDLEATRSLTSRLHAAWQIASASMVDCNAAGPTEAQAKREGLAESSAGFVRNPQRSGTEELHIQPTVNPPNVERESEHRRLIDVRDIY